MFVYKMLENRAPMFVLYFQLPELPQKAHPILGIIIFISVLIIVSTEC